LAFREARIAVSRDLDLSITTAAEALESYLEIMEIELVAVPSGAARIALDAFDRSDKGRHPARLNFADRFAYACSRYFGEPLMFKGANFAQTDIEAA